jgi:hypothetical protein
MMELRGRYIFILIIAFLVVGFAVFSFTKPGQKDLAIASYYPRSNCLLKSPEISKEVFTQNKCECQRALADHTMLESNALLKDALWADGIFLMAYALFFLVYGLAQWTFNPWGILTSICGLLAATCDFIENEGLRSLLSIPPWTPIWDWLMHLGISFDDWLKQFGIFLDLKSENLPLGMVALDLLQTMAVLKFFLIARAASSASTLLSGPKTSQLLAQGCLTISSFLMTFVCIVNMFLPLQNLLWIRTGSMYGLAIGMTLLLCGLFLVMALMLSALFNTLILTPNKPLSQTGAAQ